MQPETATLGIWTIARFAALAVLVTETLFLWTRRREWRDASQAPAGARFFWALTPALLLAGLCLWCSAHVLERSSRGPGPEIALAR